MPLTSSGGKVTSSKDKQSNSLEVKLAIFSLILTIKDTHWLSEWFWDRGSSRNALRAVQYKTMELMDSPSNYQSWLTDSATKADIETHYTMSLRLPDYNTILTSPQCTLCNKALTGGKHAYKNHLKTCLVIIQLLTLNMVYHLSLHVILFYFSNTSEWYTEWLSWDFFRELLMPAVVSVNDTSLVSKYLHQLAESQFYSILWYGHSLRWKNESMREFNFELQALPLTSSPCWSAIVCTITLCRCALIQSKLCHNQGKYG